MARLSSMTVALGFSIAAATACVGDHDGPRVLTRDSAGVAIVESSGPAWGEGSGWVVDGEPVLDLAEAGQGPDHEFFGATDGTRLSDGSLVVADQGSREIRVFSPAGVHLRTLGRAGDGPGEFRRPGQVMALPGDSILVYDYWPARVTVFAPDGTLGRITQVEGAYRPRPLLPLGNGDFVGYSTDFAGFGEEMGLHRMSYPLVRVSEAGAVTDTLAVVPGYESVVFSLGDGWALWGKDAHLAVRGDDVYVGSADSMAYRMFAPDGRLRRIARVPGYDLTLTSEDIQAERSAIMPDPSAAGEAMREIMDRQPDRTHRPAYSDLVVDALGNVWLQMFQGRHELAQPTEWLVFSPTGEWLGSVTMPPRFQIFRIGPDWILGTRPDELDVEHVQLLRLHRDGTSSASPASGRMRSRPASGLSWGPPEKLLERSYRRAASIRIERVSGLRLAPGIWRGRERHVGAGGAADLDALGADMLCGGLWSALLVVGGAGRPGSGPGSRGPRGFWPAVAVGRDSGTAVEVDVVCTRTSRWAGKLRSRGQRPRMSGAARRTASLRVDGQ